MGGDRSNAESGNWPAAPSSECKACRRLYMVGFGVGGAVLIGLTGAGLESLLSLRCLASDSEHCGPRNGVIIAFAILGAGLGTYAGHVVGNRRCGCP